MGVSLWVSWVHMEIRPNQSWFPVYKTVGQALPTLARGPRPRMLAFPAARKRKACGSQGFPIGLRRVKRA